MSTLVSDHQVALIEQFKLFYKDVKHPQLDRIEEIYSDDVRFKDPVHQIQGVAELHAYLSSMCDNVTSGRFEFLDQLIGVDTAYIKWNMYFSHPKLGKQTHAVRGMTQIQFKERIYYHEDVYDLGEMLYEHVPVLGRAVKGLKNRLSKDA